MQRQTEEMCISSESPSIRVIRIRLNVSLMKGSDTHMYRILKVLYDLARKIKSIEVKIAHIAKEKAIPKI